MKIYKENNYRSYKKLEMRKINNGVKKVKIYITLTLFMLLASGVQVKRINDNKIPVVSAEEANIITNIGDAGKTKIVFETLKQTHNEIDDNILKDNEEKIVVDSVDSVSGDMKIANSSLNMVTKLITNSKSNIIDASIRKALFNEYASYYGIDSEIAFKYAEEATNNFSSEIYLDNYVIGNTKFYKRDASFPNEEAGIIAFVRNLALSPEDFNISSNEIKIGPCSKYNGSYESFIAKISDAYNVDRNKMLAIIYHESGRLTSDAFMERNNPAGIMNDSGLKRFETKEQGIIEAIMNVGINYKDYSLEQMADKYCPVGINDDGTNKNWPGGVQDIMIELKNNPSIYDFNNEDMSNRHL